MLARQLKLAGFRPISRY